MGMLYVKKINEVKREKAHLERVLGVDITIAGRRVIFEGEALNEYEAELVFEAIEMGFPARVASTITDPEVFFEKLNIKDFTRRKNLELIKGRVIGTHGTTKKTIEEIANCRIAVKDNIVAVIGPSENMQEIITALTNLIRGTKQSNIYRFLEGRNTERKKERHKKRTESRE